MIITKNISIRSRLWGVELSDWLFIALGILIFSVITSHTIIKSPLWFDETFSAYMVKFNFFDIAKYAALDNHPPLYFWLLKMWCSVFGNTELAMRSLSLVFGCTSVLFGYLIIRRLFDKRTARISLIFLALSPMLVRYSQEVRMYTMMLAIVLAATYVLTFAIETKNKTPWVIYGILVGIGMLTHYFSALVWFAHWIWRADIIRRKSKKGMFIKSFFSKEWILAHTVAFFVFLVWLPFFIAQVFVIQATGFWIPEVNFYRMMNFFTNAIVYSSSDNITGWLAFGLFALFLLIIILAFGILKSNKKSQWQAYKLIIYLVVAPFLLLTIISMPSFMSIFINRYLLVSAFSLSMLIGVTLSIGLKRHHIIWQLLITVFASCLLICGVSNVWYYGNYDIESGDPNLTKQAIRMVADKSLNAGQPIIVSDWWLFYQANYYATINNPVYYIDDAASHSIGLFNMLARNDQHKIKDVNDFSNNNPVVWYLTLTDKNNDNIPAPYSNWVNVQQIPIYGFSDCHTRYSYFIIQYKIITKD